MIAYSKKHFSQIMIYNYNGGLVFGHCLCKNISGTLTQILQIMHIS